MIKKILYLISLIKITLKAKILKKSFSREKKSLISTIIPIDIFQKKFLMRMKRSKSYALVKEENWNIFIFLSK